MSDRAFSGSHVLVAFLAGATAGAVVAYLTAPRSGRETREELKKLGRNFAGTAQKVPTAIRSASTAAAEAFTETLKANA